MLPLLYVVSRVYDNLRSINQMIGRCSLVSRVSDTHRRRQHRFLARQPTSSRFCQFNSFAVFETQMELVEIFVAQLVR